MSTKRTISEYQTGRWVEQYKFRYYIPARLTENVEVDNVEAAMLLADASLHCGRLDGYLSNLADADSYVRHLWVKEALSWLRSEGGELSFADYHMPDNELTPRRRTRREETRRYVESLYEATKIITSSNNRKLSVRALREVHKHLMGSSKGVNLIPGMFRVEHMPVGGATLQDAEYVPPHPDEIQQLMSNFDEFIQSDKELLNPFVRVAMAHLQFLSIHPFADYNGRIVRLMTTLMLVSENIVSFPAVFLGNYIESHRRVYFDRLNIARESGNMSQWLKFVSVGLAESARESLQKTIAMQKMLHELTQSVEEMSPRRNVGGRDLLKLIFERVAVSAPEVKECLGITMPTVNALIGDFVKAGILTETTGQKKNRVYLFKQLCDIIG